jgi:hypothetical protein
VAASCLAEPEPTLSRDDISIVTGKQERAKHNSNVLILLKSATDLCPFATLADRPLCHRMP